MKTLVCVTCGKEFNGYEYGERSHYCSWKCRRTGEFVACTICGKMIYRKPALLKATSTPTCSRSCSARLALGKRYGTDGFPSEKTNIRAFRKKIFIKRGKICEVCGSKKDIHLHHKKQVHEFPELRCDPENVVVLCKVCHAKEHKEEIVSSLILSHNIAGTPLHRVAWKCEVCGLEKSVPPWYHKRYRTCSKKCGAIIGKRAEHCIIMTQERLNKTFAEMHK